MNLQPEWAASFIAMLHPAAVLLAVLLPCFRAVLRTFRGHQNGFVLTLVAQDVSSGFVLPSFVALCLSPMIPGVLTHLDGHTLQLAGALGIIYTLSELFKPRQPRPGLFES